MINQRIQLIFILAFLALTWGGGYSIAYYVTTHGMSAVGYTFWQTFGSAILLILFVIIRGTSFKFYFRYWPYYLLYALLGIVIPNTNMHIVASHMLPGVLGVVMNMTPIAIYILALIVAQERFHWLRLLGVCCAVIAMLSITLTTTKFAGFALTKWELLGIISPISFAACIVFIGKYRPKKVDSLVLSAGMLMVAAIILLPMTAAMGDIHWGISPWHLADWLVLFQIVLVSIGYVCVFQLIKIAGPVHFALVNCLVVIAGVFWGWLIFHEPLTSWLGISIILTIAAIGLISFYRSQEPGAKILAPGS